MAFKAFLSQGWSKSPGTSQNRIAFLFVMISGMLLYWHWEAMIISYLAVNKEVIPYKSFEQLLSSSNDKVYVKQLNYELTRKVLLIKIYNTLLVSNKLFGELRIKLIILFSLCYIE